VILKNLVILNKIDFDWHKKLINLVQSTSPRIEADERWSKKLLNMNYAVLLTLVGISYLMLNSMLIQIITFTVNLFAQIVKH